MRDLTRSSTADAHWLQEQMDELEGRWEAVCKLSVSKQDRLEAALQQVVLSSHKIIKLDDESTYEFWYFTFFCHWTEAFNVH